MRSTRTWVMTAVILGLVVLAGIGVSQWPPQRTSKTHIVAWFDNSNGLFVGDNVVVLGVKVGTVDAIEPLPDGAKVSLWVNRKYPIPADVRAVILSPKLITSRAIQLTPAYTGGPALADGAVITKARTAVPVEFDDFRQQLQKLTDSMQPTQPGGVSPMGQFVDTAADNLRGQGAQIRDTIIKLSQAVSALGDHSADIFGTAKNLAILVAALHDSAGLMQRLNNNLSTVTGLMTNDPGAIARAVDDLNAAINDVTGFVADNREALGTATDKLGSITKALVDSLDDVKQTLHVLPNVMTNVSSIYEPAHGAISGILSINNFANPISFLCGAIQAASRLNNEQSAKLCVQYLAPIVKNRQYNNLPIGMDPFVTAQARPNEVTYSENRLRPDYRPGSPPAAEAPSPPPPTAAPAEVPIPTDPAGGLAGLMVPAGGGQ
ncbi:MCE family protein [Mycolicibacterium sp. lyk4-40-TYG-92]|uniref:MCE family protein n=1 Tax=Mycolicibacterium sp. lyk4-40-TYG-92 TaxID=3040295 RepID=UPI00254E910F|nr:MCE family protein [Mycolicibacterium sp. lyk4-40-TYG-92]